MVHVEDCADCAGEGFFMSGGQHGMRQTCTTCRGIGRFLVPDVRREPSSTAEVYELGYFEQMQLALAVRLAIDTIEEDLYPRVTGLHVDTVKGLERIFSQPGVVTILKRVEE